MVFLRAYIGILQRTAAADRHWYILALARKRFRAETLYYIILSTAAVRCNMLLSIREQVRARKNTTDTLSKNQGRLLYRDSPLGHGSRSSQRPRSTIHGCYTSSYVYIDIPREGCLR